MRRHFVNEPWVSTARWRRCLVLALILVTSAMASARMAEVLPRRGSTGLELAIIIVFSALFAWISIGFWEAMAGLVTIARRYDRFVTARDIDEDLILNGTHARTAILMPICNEEADRVFAGLRTIYRSLEATGQLQDFHFFVLSDSTDPDKWVEEEAAWWEVCESLKAFGRIFYRHRRVNLKRKSGNIADFCRRWGRNYRYMVVLDADSIMSGPTVVRMVLLMERHPKVGILQSAPRAVNRQTPIARIQQFASHVYGPVFTAGLHFLQLGDSHFWGHNAIIRIDPFMKHCGLPHLSGRPSHDRDILSHDFVEAAFMRRGGWEVWLAYDLGGSYEETPPTLLEELKRDRRWCRGNIQHIRLLFAEGLFLAHRALFLHGALGYISAVLWVVFLGLSTAEAIVEAFHKPVYFPSGRSLFPEWPVWHPRWALTLLGTTAVLLFLPKLLSVLVIIAKKGRTRLFGGIWKLVLSFAAEVLFSAMFAPIRMLFHTRFVVMTLLGQRVGWGPQQRGDMGTGWLEALRFHWGGTLIAFLWGAILFLLNRSFFWWNTPIFIPLVLSVPLSVWSSRASVDRGLRNLGLFLIPEEVDPPPELRLLRGSLKQSRTSRSSWPLAIKGGFVRVVADPRVNALHRHLLRNERTVAAATGSRRQGLVSKALAHGPKSLSAREKKALLYDPACMHQLHQGVWETPDPNLAEMWGIPP